jgi:hypothetical protein
MQCVAKIPWMYSIISLSEIPEGRDALEREGLEIEEGAWVEVPPDIIHWPTDYEHLAERTLGRSQADPKHYKMFKNLEEAERSGFEPTGMSYGGAYTPAMWERFTTAIPAMKAFHAIPDDDDPGAGDLALSYLRRAR